MNTDLDQVLERGLARIREDPTLVSQLVEASATVAVPVDEFVRAAAAAAILHGQEPLLTEDEHRAILDAGQLWNLLCRIVGHGPSRTDDLAELCHHIHAVQHAVMKQAAARAYPGLYRLLGDVVKGGARP